MFKNSFSKYLTTFVVIILVSFLMLSGIITSSIRTHTIRDKESKLELATSLVTKHFEDREVEQLETYINTGFGSSVVTLFPLLNVNYEFDLLITNADGRVLLSTISQTEDEMPGIGGDLGNVNIKELDKKMGSDGSQYYFYDGVLNGTSEGKVLLYGDAIVTGGVIRGYVLTLASTENEDRLITVARQAVINGSIWVMLAALIAAYFITDKIVHPLKSMTGAVKKFAKGDFSERIMVSGDDEVADLALAFNNMAESLANLEKMRNTFLASVSHDLRTPMTTIAGYIDGINSGAIPPDQQTHYLNIIKNEVHRLSRLVSQILDVSRLDSGDRKFAFADFDITEVSRLILISFEQRIDDKRLDVEFNSDDDYMSAYGDKDAIYQVIYNLCHNAIKFSRAGGRFTISIARLPNKKLRLSVYDDGQKLDDEDAAHTFDRFYKSDKSRGLDKEGVGLGLYICKSIIDAHGEEIGVNVHEDGCEFWFTITEGQPISKHKSIERIQ